MVIKSLLFALLAYVLLLVISLIVVGIIKLIYAIVHRGGAEKANAK